MTTSDATNDFKVKAITPDHDTARAEARHHNAEGLTVTMTFTGLLSGPWGEAHGNIEIDHYISNDVKVLATDGNAYELKDGWYVIEGR